MSVEKFASEFNKSSLEKLNKVTDTEIMYFDRNRLCETNIDANTGAIIVITCNNECSDNFTNGMVLVVEDLIINLDDGIILYQVRSPLDGKTFGLHSSEFKLVKQGDLLKTVTYQILTDGPCEEESKENKTVKKYTLSDCPF